MENANVQLNTVVYYGEHNLSCEECVKMFIFRFK